MPIERRLRETNFDPDTTAYQSDGKGKIIKSSRKFGVEIEMFHSKSEPLAILSKTLGEAFGLHHDGSVEVAGHGIEAVSPIMQGEAGENGILEMFGKINKHGFSVNKTCGLHVHLDGAGFSKKGKVSATPVSGVGASVIKDIKSDDYALVISQRVMSFLSSKVRLSHKDAARVIADEALSTGFDNLFLSKALGQSIPEIICEPSVLDIGDCRTMIDYFDFAKEDLEMEQMVDVEISASRPEPDDWFCVVYENKSLKNVLTLLYLHTVFSDVFMSMLPKSRRQDNLYCESLDLAFSPHQIENIQSYTELEQEWYKTSNIVDTARRKGNNYDDSRYFAINLHSLFAKYGTVEVRSHSATLDPNKVLYWVALHQEIMDKIVDGSLTIEKMRRGTHLREVEAKTEFILTVLNLRQPLYKYVRQRIAYFKAKDK